MKKIISAVLSLVVVFTALFFPCNNIIKEKITLSEIAKTSAEVTEMIKKYDENFDNAKNRIIVKSDSKIDEYGAIDSVYGFGYAFLQFANNELAKSAYNKYNSDGYMVSYDSMINTQAYEEYTDDWALKETDAISETDYYKLKVKSKIVIAVVDTGLDYNHNSMKNRYERTNVNFSSSGYSNDESDDHGHGTMVSGVIVQSTPSNVKIQAYKVGNNEGKGSLSQLVSTLTYISELSDKPEIINMSLGFSTNATSNSPVLEEIINTLVGDGITVVAAAGNDGNEVDYMNYPAYYDNVITVAATDIEGQPCDFSSYGASVDISAPGKKIFTSTKGNSYSTPSGTSFSAPFVSAAAAIVLMEHSSYTPEQIKQELIDTATPFKKSDCNNYYGAGIVNFSNIITGTRCKEVTSNFAEGIYNNDISVELNCQNSLVNIIYTTDGTLPSEDNGTIYTNPIEITQSTRIIVAAFAKIGSTFHGKYTSLDYYILKNGEPEYVIDDTGNILNYLGTQTNLTVPDEIEGAEPTAISINCFRYTNIENLVLPDSVKTIHEAAFRGTPLKSIKADGVTTLKRYCFEGSQLQEANFPNAETEIYAFNNTPIVSASIPNIQTINGGFVNCTELKSIDISGVRGIDYEPFLNCTSLTQDLRLENCTWIGNRAFANSNFKSIILPECNGLQGYVFDNAKAETIKLGKVATIPSYTFNDCTKLKTVYAQSTTSINRQAFENCTALETLFIPLTREFYIDIPSNLTIFIDRNWQRGYEVYDYTYTIVAPKNSIAYRKAVSFNYNVIDSLQTSFTEIEGNNFVYTCSTDGQTIKVPIWLGEEMWKDYLPINKASSFMTHGYLIDVVPDEIINGKDFAKIHKATEQ